MIRISFLAVIAACSVATTPWAQADIYKCTDEEGNVAYLQVPCPAKPVAPVETAATDNGAEPEEPVEPEAEYSESPPVPSSREPGEPLAECEKRYRDQIDAAEEGFFATDLAEQEEIYKERLLALAQQLRACG